MTLQFDRDAHGVKPLITSERPSDSPQRTIRMGAIADQNVRRSGMRR